MHPAFVSAIAAAIAFVLSVALALIGVSRDSIGTIAAGSLIANIAWPVAGISFVIGAIIEWIAPAF